MDTNDRKYYPVLDKGFVALVDHMGSDAAIVQAARISYGAGTKKVSEDRALIRYLMSHEHLTPFEMCEVKLHVRVPMDCWRQWIRHRTANVNEYSTRYSNAIDDMQQTGEAQWRLQSTSNKQGSAGYLDMPASRLLSDEEHNFQNYARDIYKMRLSLGVAREQARKDLPLSTYTEAYWKIDLRNLFNFLALRLDSHAQLEIRSYARVIAGITKQLFPLAFEAFEDNILYSMKLTVVEQKILMELLAVPPGDGIMAICEKYSLGKRETEDFLQKIDRLRQHTIGVKDNFQLPPEIDINNT